MFKSIFAGRSSVKPTLKMYHVGKSKVFNQFKPKILGRSRVANDSLIGYCVFVGVGVLPDLNSISAFSETLPITIPLTPPMSTSVVNVLVRKRNKYGLFSQNQKCFSFTVNSSGDLVNYELSPPTGILASIIDIGKIRVMGTYSNYNVDVYPATAFRVWIGTTPPDVNSDPFTIEQTTEGSGTFGVNLPDTYSPGTYHVAMTLVRNNWDGFSSTPITTTVIVPDLPNTPQLFN